MTCARASALLKQLVAGVTQLPRPTIVNSAPAVRAASTGLRAAASDVGVRRCCTDYMSPGAFSANLHVRALYQVAGLVSRVGQPVKPHEAAVVELPGRGLVQAAAGRARKRAPAPRGA